MDSSLRASDQSLPMDHGFNLTEAINKLSPSTGINPAVLKELFDEYGKNQESAEYLVQCLKNHQFRTVSDFRKDIDKYIKEFGTLELALKTLRFLKKENETRYFIYFFHLLGDDWDLAEPLAKQLSAICSDRITSSEVAIYNAAEKEKNPEKLRLVLEIASLRKLNKEDAEFFYNNMEITDLQNILANIDRFPVKEEMPILNPFEGPFNFPRACLGLKNTGIPFSALESLNVDHLEKIQKFTSSLTKRFGDLSEIYPLPNGINPTDYGVYIEKARNLPHLYFLLATSLDEDEIVEKFKNIPFSTPENICEHYVVRRKDIRGAYGMDQEKYGNALHEASVIGAIAIQDKHWNLDQLLKFLSSQRKQTADMLNQKHSKNIYGLLRIGPYETPCENIYKAAWK